MNPKFSSSSVLNFAVLVAFAMQLTSGSGQNASTNENTISRKVQINVRKSSGMRGMTAMGKVVVGGNATTDSFNSADPGKSTNGRYDPAKAGEDGFIGTTSTSSSYEMEIKDNARIIGPIATGAPGVLKLVRPAVVGSRAFVNAGNEGLEAGYLRTDLNVSFPDVPTPNLSSPRTPTSGNVNGTNYDFVFGTGNYVLNDFKVDGNKKAIVTGTAVIHVNGTFAIEGKGIMTIANGAKLDMYVGSEANIGGEGIANLTGKAENFTYYGLKNNKQIYYSGKATWVGTVYAPSAKMDLTGDSEFMGASVSGEIVLGGNFKFHYDEALGSTGGRYLPVAWKEL